MSRYKFTESTVEEAALEWFDGLGYSVLNGPEIALGEPATERQDYGEVILPGRLRDALSKLNSKFPQDVREDGLHKLLRSEHPTLIENNRRFHQLLVDGLPVECQSDGRTVYDSLNLIDFENPDANDWLAVNQFTVIEDRHNRRPDLVVFINGLPIAVFEFKNAADENATAKHGFKQFQTYKQEIPSLFVFNENLVTSDGIDARTGTLTSDWERFMPWRTIDGKKLASEKLPQLEVLIKGVFEKRRLLELIRWFIVFEESKQRLNKKMAGYHQFHAVEKAVDATIKAVRGDHRVGIVWHTQGSGKSLTMVFYAGKIIQHPVLENPTLIILTDRNDLDDQLFNQTFVPCKDLLRQTPVQAESRSHLRELLSRSSGGVIFTTIQKFLPEELGWVKIENNRLDDQMFVAQVCGQSMEPRIPDGSYCIFRARPAGSRQGKIVLVQYRGPADADTGGQFTVKCYESTKRQNPDGTWEHELIRLNPINPKFQPIEIDPKDSDDIQVLAEFVEVLK